MPNKQTKRKANARPKKGKTSTPSGVANAMEMPRTVRGPARAPRPTHSRNAIVESVCAITDPFCPRAKNAKWPDGLGGNTMTMQIRFHDTAQTGAAGATLRYCSAALPFSFIGGTYSAGNFTLSAAYSDATAGTNFTTYADTYRVVTWGIIVRNLLPALSASGFITVSRQTTMPAESSVIAAGSTAGSQVETHPMFAGQEIHIIGKTQGTGSRALAAKNTSTTTATGWEVIKIEGTGLAASSTVFDIEFVYNVEFTLPESQAALHSFVTPVVPSAPKAIEAANVVHSRINSVVAGGIDKVGSTVVKAASTAVEDIFAGALGWMGL